jgi:cell wall-associated NlpC family hydrolase
MGSVSDMKRLLAAMAVLGLFAAVPAVSLADATHVVRKGDTLGKIARAYHVSVPKIKAANGLDGTRLAIGKKLVIPGAKARPKKARVGANKADPPGATAAGEAGIGAAQRHTVRKGESLRSIARTYDVTERDLRVLNRLRRKARPRPGTQLIVRESIPAEDPQPGPQLALVEPQIDTRTQTAGKLPSEAELAEAAKASDTAAAPPFDAAPEAPRAGEPMKDRLLRVAQRMLSVPYRFGGTTLWGLDCSGFVQKAFSFLNLDLPRSAREQFGKGAAIEKADLSPGDLVFFRTYAKYPSHVGIYLGDNRFVHASSRERKVTIDSLETPYYVKRYIGAKRLLFEENDIQN